MPLIQKSNLCDEAFNYILGYIAQNHLVAGDKLPSENELVQKLGVSRSTVRSALSKINALGVLEARHGGGYFVRDANVSIYVNQLLPFLVQASDDLETLTEFRIGIEPQSAYLAAQRRSKNDLFDMQRAIDRMATSMEDDLQFALSDMEFHLYVAKASGNEILYHSFELVKTLYSVWLQGFVREHGKQTSHSFHQRILEAIRKQDGDSAMMLMRDHMTDVLVKVLKDKFEAGR